MKISKQLQNFLRVHTYLYTKIGMTALLE